ncbi:MAG: acetyl-CoA C-acetyltransferase [Myxococcales bacterium]|nr:acetyl-CoA C-acetyltransferase [Myxococcales bacterium]
MREVVIVGAARTPIGSFGGALSTVAAPILGSTAIKAALRRASVSPDQVDEVIMGSVLTAGMGQAPARQASLGAGIPNSVPCMTINKVCGSGLKATMLGAQSIQLGNADIVVAGGMENMSLVPYSLPTARYGQRMGHGQLIDLMIHDGLWDVYNNYHMGNAGELCARDGNFSRQQQDDYAIESYRRATAAIAQGIFETEIIPVEIPNKKGTATFVTTDEEPSRGDVTKFASLRPAFAKDGTITAANASSINDGAAAVVLMGADVAQKLRLTPLARIVSTGTHAQAPEWFTTAPAKSIAKALERVGLTPADVDLFEINEAFAVVALAAIQELQVDPSKVNVFGGAVALGHPIGASGARLLVTLLTALKHHNKNRGVVSLCIGGGEAVAMVVERGLS